MEGVERKEEGERLYARRDGCESALHISCKCLEDWGRRKSGGGEGERVKERSSV